MDVFLGRYVRHVPQGGGPLVDPGLNGGTVFRLALERLNIFLDELEEVSG